MKLKIIILFIYALMLNTLSLNAQEQNLDDLFKLSLEELMNIEIVSASKESENLFEAPVSSYVITKEDIFNAGITSIPEALRLAPGMIVREQTNGNYDIHIRGLNNVPLYSDFSAFSNSMTLVMINNRVVYNYFAGGTFWETLPIDLNDVERIEIIRGPSSPLYGPNAATGVIHIFTKDFSEYDDFIAEANTSLGSFNTQITNVNIAKTINHFNIGFTANVQNRERQNSSYYEILNDTFLTDLKTMKSISSQLIDSSAYRYPAIDNSMKKYGVNLYSQYKTEDLLVKFNGGYQNSEVQYIYVETKLTPISTNTSESMFADLDIEYKGLKAKISTLNGEQETLGEPDWKYDFNTLDASLEYTLDLNKLKIKPNVNFRNAKYNGVFIAGEQSISTIAAALYVNYLPFEGARILGVGRIDKYDTPDTYEFSYEFVASYNFKDIVLLRAGSSKSHQAPFMLNNFKYVKDEIIADSYYIYELGNTELDLLTINQIEFGAKFMPFQNLFLDIDVFKLETENYSQIHDSGFTGDWEQGYELIRKQQNTDTKAIQQGFSASVNYIPIEKLQIKAFVTYQETDIENQASSYAIRDDSEFSDTISLATPEIYGGFFVNYSLNQKINLNLSSYFYGEQFFSYRHKDYVENNNYHKVNSKFILNASVSYKLNHNVRIYGTVKNISGNKDREFAFADEVGRSFNFGVSFRL